MRFARPISALGVALFCADVSAQQGDRSGERQPPLPERFQREPSPPLSPEDALRSFTLQPGYRIELVASEPLVEDPVAMTFDASGKLWVVEMRGYMNDIDGSDEFQPIGRIVILEDTNGDGRMDTSTPFLDHLILPRAIAPSHGGLLVVEPPHLLRAVDVDGDLISDQVDVLATGFGGLDNPEHAGNGLSWGMDGWYECSQHPYRYKIKSHPNDILLQSVRSHGQWGVAVDDFGHCWYSPNSEPLLVDFYPKKYAVRNPNQVGFHGIGMAAASSRRTRPVVPTPGVNRGYQNGVLDDTGRLSHFTGACGTGVYRDNLLGSDIEGDIFVCEVAGNLVKRFKPTFNETTITCDPVDDNGEFIASTDERFRPVQVMTGPDGALYVCDMYRGIIQHRIYMTSFLRGQIIDRGLELPAALGRIWRIVPDVTSTREIPDLRKSGSLDLLEYLDHPNGTIRDTAQRLIIERCAVELEDELRIRSRKSPLVERRMRALWTLSLLGTIRLSDLDLSISDPSSLVRRTVLRIAENHLEDDDLLRICRIASQDGNEAVRVQSALSIGSSSGVEYLSILPDLLSSEPNSRSMRSAIQSSLGGMEIAFLEQVERQVILSEENPINKVLLQDVVDLVMRGRDSAEIEEILSFVAHCPDDRQWQARLIVDRMVSNLRLGTPNSRTARITSPPVGWPELLSKDETSTTERIRMIDEALRWPDRDRHLGIKTVDQSEMDVNDLDSMIAHGRRVYTQCLSCHQGDGRGLYPVYPPLADSEYVTGDPALLASIILHGIEGRLSVSGRIYNQSMPPAPIRNDQDIAAVMTYVRQAWGNQSSAVTPDFVAEVRRSTQGQVGPLRAADIYLSN